MRKGKYLLIIFMFIAVLISFHQFAFSSLESKPTQPILDTGIDPTLRLVYSELTLDVGPGIPNAHEYWERKDNEKVSIIIDRWFFKNPDEITKFMNSVDCTGLVCCFKKWDKISDIGDKTYWIYPYMVVFAKNNVLVKVYARISILKMSPEEQKEYTKRLATNIENKL